MVSHRINKGGGKITERNIKGLKNELYCQYYFSSIGYNVSVPLGEDCKYDLIVDFNGNLTRIQVKACTEEENGITFSVSSSSLKSGGKSIRRIYTKEDIDYFATVYKEEVYMVPVELCGKSQKKLLFDETKRFNTKNSTLEKYKAENQIKRIISGRTIDDLQSYILQLDSHNNVIHKFKSISEAAKSIGKTREEAVHITDCCRGKRKTAFGFHWKYSK